MMLNKQPDILNFIREMEMGRTADSIVLLTASTPYLV